MYLRSPMRTTLSVVSAVLLMQAGLRAETFTVTTTADTGPGSLRQAIVAANANPGPDVIAFAIPAGDAGYDAGTGTWTITPQSELTNLIDMNTLIDGFSQRDFIGGDPNPDGPEIILDGNDVGSATGLEVKGDLCTIQHLTIYGFLWDCIRIHSDSCAVLGCYLGTGYDGNAAGPAAGYPCGITVFGNDNYIGGLPEGHGNIISGNQANGITVSGGHRNTIAGNYVGVNTAADAAVPNDYGIVLVQKSSHNIIGPGNVIAGNTYCGIQFFSAGSDTNYIVQNFIGTNSAGDDELGNGEYGIRIERSGYNTIGGDTPEEGNIISGNGRHGIALFDSTRGNSIRYNTIGLKPDGSAALGNEWSGIEMHSGAHQNIIGPGNCIAYNGNSGISVQSDESNGNRITENSIFQNGFKGINLAGAANDSIQPPVITRMGSVIGTAKPGSLIEIFSTENDEGRDHEGSTWTDGAGIFHWDGTPAGPYVTATATDPDNNTSEFSPPRYTGDLVVTTTADTGAGSLRMAILFAGENVGPDTIRFKIPAADPGFSETAGTWTIALNDPLVMDQPGTYIDGMSQANWYGPGTNPDGPAIYIVPGTDNPYCAFQVDANRSTIARLAISYFESVQIRIESDSNSVQGCYLCCGATGSESPGIGTGIWILGGHCNTIGGDAAESGNVISGMAGDRDGIQVYNQAAHTIISHNIIGLNAAGDEILGGYAGVSISGRCLNSVIGPGNVIGGLQASGIMVYDVTSSHTNIFGNLIGTDLTGTQSRGNGVSGITISGESSLITIGGVSAAERNIISGNRDHGILLSGGDVDSVTITGNYIGTAADGISAVPNGCDGIHLFHANHNSIGGVDEQAGNLICGNTCNGIVMYEPGAGYNSIAGNSIGVAADAAPLPNGGNGILLYGGAHNNRIGPGNTIANNSGAGVRITDTESVANTVTRNSIWANSEDGIDLQYGANNDMQAPVITGLGSVTGTAAPGSLVEVFSGPDPEGKVWIDSVTADGAGDWTILPSPDGPCITATATDADGNTSPFSYPAHVGPYLVTNTLNTGEGSLRAAMEAANANAGPDSIHFAIPRSDPGFDGTCWRIVPTYPLPLLLDNGLTIDGTTQDSLDNANENGPDILIDGSEGGTYFNGLAIYSSHNVIAGLIIGGCSHCAVLIDADTARSNTIRGCYIGTDPAGSDTLGGQSYGIIIARGNRQLIGGENPEEGNLISGNRSSGCRITSDSTLVINNIIGLDRTGTMVLANEQHGLYIQGGCNTIGAIPGGTGKRTVTGGFRVKRGDGKTTGNLISGNGLGGIRFDGESAVENTVIGNTIGLDEDGEHARANGSGVELFNGAHNNHILFNVISGNRYWGVDIGNADSNRVQGNFVGTSADGTLAVPNQNSGITMRARAGWNLIGGRNAGEENLISGNIRSGVDITDNNSDNNRVLGNLIGTAANGSTPLPNQQHGISIRAEAALNVIGPGNTIAYNLMDGVLVTDNGSWANTITANSIFSNGRTGINLLNGGNYEIQAPVITGTNPLTGTTTMAHCLVEIFSDSLDQGRVFEDSVRCGPGANFTWHGTPAGPFITATATINGATSMFSDSIAVNTSVDRLPETAPRTFALRQNYPNPFNPETTLEFDVAEPCRVTLKLFDLLGRELLTLVDEQMEPGAYQAVLRAERLPSGTYIYRITMGGFTAARKLTVLQ
ncbi:right-handed parallel beta-helix repeat-containing protein [bacterium]|nr:right-handed parallel beta-helix repeat-containing protein [bacterium]